jgi:hypothetical protein
MTIDPVGELLLAVQAVIAKHEAGQNVAAEIAAMKEAAERVTCSQT